jgi:transposase
MAKYKTYNYDQTVMLPVSLTAQLQPGTLAWGINEVIERMDVSGFDAHFKNDETGRTAYHPKILLKVVLYGYSQGVLQSRRMEAACKENVIFMALSCNQTPDHTTIATFISSMQGEILDLFRKVLLICDQAGLLGGTVFAVDGCRIPGNASKDWSGTFDELCQKKERLEKKLQRMLEKHERNDCREDVVKDREDEERKRRRLEKDIEKVDRFLQEQTPKPGSKKKENKSNVTDNDSMLMKTPHGTIQGYNAQALVDAKHQVIVHTDPGHGVRDDEHLDPLVSGAQENLAAIQSTVDLTRAQFLGDAGYHSQTNIKTCRGHKLDAYIPDNDFRRRDSRYTRSETKFSVTDFEYIASEDGYRCPAGKRLIRGSDKSKVGKPIYRTYQASQKDCGMCGLKDACLSNKAASRRFLSVFHNTEIADYASLMQKKLSTEAGKRFYNQRIGIIEPVFANISVHKGMNRFLLRGKIKVGIQWMLYCMVHNIEKIIRYGDHATLGWT